MLTEAEDAVYLRHLLKELSQDTREVIILRIYEEMKFKDIAKIMGCSVSTTKSRFRLGVNQLKKFPEQCRRHHPLFEPYIDKSDKYLHNIVQ